MNAHKLFEFPWTRKFPQQWTNFELIWGAEVSSKLVSMVDNHFMLIWGAQVSSAMVPMASASISILSLVINEFPTKHKQKVYTKYRI